MIEGLEKKIERSARLHDKNVRREECECHNGICFKGYANEEVIESLSLIADRNKYRYVHVGYDDIVILKVSKMDNEEYSVHSNKAIYNYDGPIAQEEYENLLNSLSDSFLIVRDAKDDITLNKHTFNLLNKEKTILTIFNLEDHSQDPFRWILLDFTKLKIANGEHLKNLAVVSISIPNDVDNCDFQEITEHDGKNQFVTKIINKKYNIENLYNIVNEYWKDYNEKSCDPNLSKYIVNSSIPVVWFGNVDDYFDSPIRTLTIAINPSLVEFLKDGNPDVSLRFPSAKNIDKQYDPKIIVKALNEYFRTNPYSPWFKCYDAKCMGFVRDDENGYDVGYNMMSDPKKHENTALHIDLETAIATNPTWGKINDDIKNELKNPSLFMGLLNFLDPNVLFISINKKEFMKFGSYVNYDLSDPLYVSSSGKMKCYLCNGKLIVFGRNCRQPFAPISDEEKKIFFKNVFSMVKFEQSSNGWLKI